MKGNRHVMLFGVILGVCLSTQSYAQTVDQEYTNNLKKYQQVCKGKAAGDQVTFAHKAVIWNGTCEPVFTLSNTKMATASLEQEAYALCQQDAAATSISVNGKEIKGKCTLTYTPPMPK